MKTNRRAELFPNVTDEQWNDWKWQVKNRIETFIFCVKNAKHLH